MSTYAQMQAKIADDLNRSDLTTQIQREINRAIRKFGSMPMWFSSTSANFVTANGQQSYDTADGLPSDIRIVDYLRVNQSSPTIITAGGTANAITLTPSPAASSYADGDQYYFKATATNTGATTVNVSSLGITDITRPNAVALQAGDITSGQVYSIIYQSSASDFYLMDRGGTYYDLYESGIDVILRRNVNDNPGLPLNYAWFDSKLYFYPTPDQAYIVTVYYEKYYADLSGSSDTNDFTTNPEAEQLIENEVEYQIYKTIILDDERAQACLQNRDRALSVCRRITSNFNGVHGFIRPTDF